MDDPAGRRDGEPVVRPGARVVVIDAAGRVLLFACTGDDGRRFWVPPGGGCEPGEKPEETARRELREETGLTDVAIACELGRRRAVASWGGVTYDSRERWILVRVAAFEPAPSGLSVEERAAIDDHRWWTVEELEATPDRLVPGRLAELDRGWLRDGPPDRPIDLGA
jgi:ADP-ribose pyrophosphatase YjhB (NUDIX family)